MTSASFFMVRGPNGPGIVLRLATLGEGKHGGDTLKGARNAAFKGLLGLWKKTHREGCGPLAIQWPNVLFFGGFTGCVIAGGE
jgi:hypothetical protein